jgi:hypothetical protein
MRAFASFAAGSIAALALGATGFAQEAQPTTTPAPVTPAPSPSTPSTPATSAATPGAAPAAKPAAEGKAKIIFFRPWNLVGGVYKYHVVEVGDDGKSTKETALLGDLANGGAFTLEADAGVHSYNIRGPMSVNKAEDRLRIDLEPDTTYYIEQQVRMGVVTGGFKLAPSDEAHFKDTKVKMDKGKK